MPDSLLYDLATDLLDTVVTRLGAAGVTVPSRCYVHAGQVALDAGPGDSCEDQLVVSFTPGDFQGLPGLPDDTALICEQPPVAIYEIWLSRCVPTIENGPQVPSPEELTDAAKITMEDAREVWRAVYLAYKAGELFDGTCTLTRMAGGRVQGPEGGVTSYVMTVEVSLI